jgi:hypothetical protein
MRLGVLMYCRMVGGPKHREEQSVSSQSTSKIKGEAGKPVSRLYLPFEEELLERVVFG